MRAALLLAALLAGAARAEPEPQPWPYDLLDVRLELAADAAARKLRGRATHTLRVRPAPEAARAQAVLRAEGNLTIAAVWLGERKLRFEHAAPRLTIRWPAPLAVGSEVALAIDYAVTRGGRGVYFVGKDRWNPDRQPQLYTQSQPDEGAAWFPGYHHPDDKATSELIVRVPRGQRVISNGELIDAAAPERDGRTRWRFRQSKPHSTYLIALMVGPFHSVGVGRHRQAPLSVHAPARVIGKARQAVRSTKAMMGFVEGFAGKPYPWVKYAQVWVAEYGWAGMEHTGASTLDEEQLEGDVAGGSADWLIAHELAHQWFGDAITCKRWRDIWLNEGFATYLETRWYRQRWGRTRFQLERREMQRRYLRIETTDAPDRAKPVVRVEADPNKLFDQRAYEKGGAILFMLEHELGAEVFRAGVQRYCRRHWLGTVETADLRRALEAESGRSLERLFRQWLHRGGYPVLSASHRWRPDGQGAGGVLEVELQQTQPVSWPTFALTLEVAVGLAGDRPSRRFAIGERKQTLRWRLPSRPRYVQLDDPGVLLCRLRHRRPVRELAAQLAGDPTPLGRLRAARQLGALGGGIEIQRLLAAQLAREREPAIRAALARRLAREGGSLAVAALLDQERDPEATVRLALAEALAGGGSWSDPSARWSEREPTLRRLTRDPDADVAAAATEGLLRLEVEGHPRLLGAALADPRIELRLMARAALRRRGDESAFARLAAELDRGGRRDRVDAREELARMLKARPDAHRARYRALFVPRLIAGKPFERAEAARALGAMSDLGLRSLFERRLKRERDPSVKAALEGVRLELALIDPQKRLEQADEAVAKQAERVAAAQRELGRLKARRAEAAARLQAERRRKGD